MLPLELPLASNELRPGLLDSVEIRGLLAQRLPLRVRELRRLLLELGLASLELAFPFGDLELARVCRRPVRRCAARAGLEHA